MRNRILLLICGLLMCIAAQAQVETDFAENYLKLYATNTSLYCQTVSPTMINRMLSMKTLSKDRQAQQALQCIKSVRIVSNRNAGETSGLFDKAKSLLQQNSDRFAHFNDYDGKTIYVRRKGDTIVEAVLLTKTQGRLYIVDVTGNMTEAVIKSLITKDTNTGRSASGGEYTKHHCSIKTSERECAAGISLPRIRRDQNSGKLTTKVALPVFRTLSE